MTAAKAPKKTEAVEEDGLTPVRQNAEYTKQFLARVALVPSKQDKLQLRV